MRDVQKIFLFVVAVVLVLGCSQNAFLSFANTQSDAALLFDAQQKMTVKNYTAAITDLLAMSSSAQAQRSTQDLLASAYAGRCGLDLIAMVNSLQATSTQNLFLSLLVYFKGAKAVQSADCVTAENTVLAISNMGSNRTVDENTLMAFIGLTDTGVLIASSADPTAAGVVAAGWDSCSTSPFGPAVASPGGATDAASRQIGVDINIIYDALTAPGMPTLLNGVTTNLSTVCNGTICGTSPPITDKTSFSQASVKAIEGVIRTSDYPGLNVPGAGSLPGAICP